MTTPVVSAIPWVFAFSMQAEQSIVVHPKSPGGVDSPHGLILFDGVCVLCSRGCGFVSKHDRRGYFRFVPLMTEKEVLGVKPTTRLEQVGEEHPKCIKDRKHRH